MHNNLVRVRVRVRVRLKVQHSFLLNRPLNLLIVVVLVVVFIIVIFTIITIRQEVVIQNIVDGTNRVNFFKIFDQKSPVNIFLQFVVFMGVFFMLNFSFIS